MQIRHCVEFTNVDCVTMFVINHLNIRHAVVKAGKISSLSGMIDPKSHLNLDYPMHLVKNCIMCKEFQIGSEVKIFNGGFVFAFVRPQNYEHFGKYDYTQNLKNMIDAIGKLRTLTIEKKRDVNFNNLSLEKGKNKESENNVISN